MKYESGIYFDKLPKETEAQLSQLGMQSSSVRVAIRSDMDLNGAFQQNRLIYYQKFTEDRRDSFIHNQIVMLE
jgi:hypothetical protein